MLRRVARVRTDLSEESVASIIWVTKIGELGTESAVTSDRSTLRNVGNSRPTPFLTVALHGEVPVRGVRLVVVRTASNAVRSLPVTLFTLVASLSDIFCYSRSLICTPLFVRTHKYQPTRFCVRMFSERAVHQWGCAHCHPSMDSRFPLHFPLLRRHHSHQKLIALYTASSAVCVPAPPAQASVPIFVTLQIKLIIATVGVARQQDVGGTTQAKHGSPILKWCNGLFLVET
jgi:hypothetical protein